MPLGHIIDAQDNRISATSIAIVGTTDGVRGIMTYRVSIVVGVICVLCLFSGIALCVERQSYLQGQALAEHLSQYRGVTIRLHTSEKRYIQGQYIWMVYHITCDQPRPLPWRVYDIDFGTKLLRDGMAITHESGDIIDEGFHRPQVGSVFEDSLFLSGSFYNNEILGRCGISAFLPGHYIGYFDMGLVSPDFEFDVDPVPDSLAEDWNTLCMLGQHRYDTRGTDVESVLDSATTALRNVLIHPPLYPLRKENLSAGIRVFGVLRNGWRPSDSLFCVTLITEFAKEPGIAIERMMSAITSVLFKDLESAEKKDQMTSFVRSLSRPDLLRVVQSRYSR
jgi:hypothetical protein